MIDKRFDVIVVGAGPAGCVLASRLSEDPDRHILLLEAGPDAEPGAEHPDMLDPYALFAYHNAAFRWPGLQAEVSPDSGNGTARPTVPYLQACMVGGASNLNGMGVDRGQPADYDEWCGLGADGWDWPNVLPYFIKLERDLDFPEARAHGDRGPMPVRRLSRSRWAPFAVAMGAAWQRRGFPFLDDYMTDFRDGYAEAPTNCLIDRRMSASMGYLTSQVRGRPNLRIIANARVERVTLTRGRADGVIMQVNGGSRTVHASDVVLCCGAIWSPTLLLRSGIGPVEHLRKHAIGVVRDLPGVGANLQNHPTATLAAYLKPSAKQQDDNPWLLQNWLRFSSGYPNCEPGDMHLMAFNKCDWHTLGRRIGAVAATVLKSYSRGHIELTGAASTALPNVRFNLLDDARDYERLVQGVRFVLELMADPAVAHIRHDVMVPNMNVAAKLSPRTRRNGLLANVITQVFDIPSARRALLRHVRIEVESLLSDDGALRRLVRKLAHPQFHVSGTCRMGRASDPEAVVDGQGRVHGIEALRVVDASIFPTMPRAYTHFPVIMAAEKIADAMRGKEILRSAAAG